MKAFDSRPARGRSVFTTLATAVVLSVGLAGGASAQTTPAQAPAPQAPDQYKFSADSMVMFIGVAETSGADFESFMAQVKDVAAKSEKPERQQQAASWKLIKIETPQNGVITYILLLEKVVKEASYDLFKILSEGMPPDKVKEVYDKIGPNIKSISFAPVKVG